MQNENTIKMLWIESSAYFMSKIYEGFIVPVNELLAKEGQEIDHFWWKCGDYFSGLPAPMNMTELDNAAKANMTTHAAKNRYDIIASNLVLWQQDISKLKEPMDLPIMSMAAISGYIGRTDIVDPKCVLYTDYGIDGGIDGAWKKRFVKIYPEFTNNTKNISVYDKAYLSGDNGVNLKYISKVAKDILPEKWGVKL